MDQCNPGELWETPLDYDCFTFFKIKTVTKKAISYSQTTDGPHWI